MVVKLANVGEVLRFELIFTTALAASKKDARFKMVKSD